MLRYKTETRPGLVALYDIRPENGAGQSYNPGARTGHARLKDKVTIAQEETIPNIMECYCLVTLIDLQTRRVCLSASAELIVCPISLLA